MGVGLVSKYRYSLDKHLRDLKDDFRAQIEKYLPECQAVEVNVYIKDKICYINATVDNVIYAFFYDSDKNDLNTTYKSLSDI